MTPETKNSAVASMLDSLCVSLSLSLVSLAWGCLKGRLKERATRASSVASKELMAHQLRE